MARVQERLKSSRLLLSVCSNHKSTQLKPGLKQCKFLLCIRCSQYFTEEM